MRKQKIVNLSGSDTDKVNKLLDQGWGVQILKTEDDAGYAWVVLEYNPDDKKQKIFNIGGMDTDKVNKLLEQGWIVRTLKTENEMGYAWVVLEYDPDN